MSYPSCLEGRLQTFKQLGWPHRVSGKRKDAAASAVFKVTPETLAQAGFFRRQIDGSLDNVACQFCRKNLDGWAPEDSAWTEHVKHSPNCPIVRMDLEVNREISFLAASWPHGNLEGHHDGGKGKGSITASKMAKAGFFFWPVSDDKTDDTAICVQCGLSLDGWEPNDDPRHEHERRRPNCPFLVTGRVHRPAFYEHHLASLPPPADPSIFLQVSQDTKVCNQKSEMAGLMDHLVSLVEQLSADAGFSASQDSTTLEWTLDQLAEAAVQRRLEKFDGEAKRLLEKASF